MRPVKKRPPTAIASTAWVMIRFTRSSSPAPIYLAICTAKPMATAFMTPLMSQILEVPTATAAVAVAPRETTMAVSTYCTRVCKICSTMVGQARKRMIRRGGMDLSKRSRVLAKGMPPYRMKLVRAFLSTGGSSIFPRPSSMSFIK